MAKGQTGHLLCFNCEKWPALTKHRKTNELCYLCGIVKEGRNVENADEKGLKGLQMDQL